MFESTPEKQIKDYAKELPPEDKKEILEGLKELKNARRNAKYFSILMDWGMVDALVGAIPEIGDAGTALAGLYIVYQAKKMGMSTGDLMKMMGNQLKDMGIGAVPIAGDALDAFYMSNRKNFKMLDAYFKDPKNTDKILGTIETKIAQKKESGKKEAETNLIALDSARKRAQLKKQEKIDRQAA